MLEEAQKPKYLVDAFWLKHFNRFPRGCDPDQFNEVQREFVVYLYAAAPSSEQMETWFRYEIDRKAVEERDWLGEVKKDKTVNESVIAALAAKKGQDIESYRRQYLERKAQERKQAELARIKEKWGLVDDGDEHRARRDQILEKYRSMSNELENKAREQPEMKRLSGFQKLFEKPGQEREEG